MYEQRENLQGRGTGNMAGDGQEEGERPETSELGMGGGRGGDAGKPPKAAGGQRARLWGGKGVERVRHKLQSGAGGVGDGGNFCMGQRVGMLSRTKGEGAGRSKCGVGAAWGMDETAREGTRCEQGA